jgi:3-dehydroquinate synthase
VGSKTGIDFMNYKNQLGLFHDPEAVFIYTGFLKTLPDRELHSAFAEVIKHYMIADGPALMELYTWFLETFKAGRSIRDADWDSLVDRNIYIKSQIVAQDKFEADTRKALNFGHTIGHAMETYYLNLGKPILHGEAVAIGIICEARFTIPPGPVYGLVQMSLVMVFEDLPELPKRHIPQILRLIKQDKKNASGLNQFTLVPELGAFSVNNYVEESAIRTSLEYYSEFTKIHVPRKPRK